MTDKSPVEVRRGDWERADETCVALLQIVPAEALDRFREVLAKSFAEHRLAQPAPEQQASGDVDPELVERVRYAVEHPDAQGFMLAKAGMTRHDFRRILAALAPTSVQGDRG